MKTVEKKCNKEYFEQVLSGSKTFELRLQDFDIEEGDTFLLKEWDPETKSYTGRELTRIVGYVGKWKLADLTQFYSQSDLDKKGIQIISLK